jgi:hypothetical protein
VKRREPVACQTAIVSGTPVRIRGRGPLAEGDRAALAVFVEALTAQQRVVHLQPGRPRRTYTVRQLWLWGALGLPCREPVDGIRRCGACPCCEARAEALRVWCP